VRVLVDTHVLLWMMSRSARLSGTAREALADPINELCFSLAGYWEMGIKMSLGKLELAPGWDHAIPREMARNGIDVLPITPAHVHEVTKLPWIHRDPFDRLMIAQAIVEKATILTSDRSFPEYTVPVLW
jgi:PIN domain nuclease of toxin-antitoxin system